MFCVYLLYQFAFFAYSIRFWSFCLCWLVSIAAAISKTKETNSFLKLFVNYWWVNATLARYIWYIRHKSIRSVAFLLSPPQHSFHFPFFFSFATQSMLCRHIFHMCAVQTRNIAIANLYKMIEWICNEKRLFGQTKYKNEQNVEMENQKRKQQQHTANICIECVWWGKCG